jgi:hypothetical protein
MRSLLVSSRLYHERSIHEKKIFQMLGLLGKLNVITE